jgi:hypothetical protein
MKKIILIKIMVLLIVVAVNAQPILSTEPRVFTAEDEVTLNIDVTGTGLDGFTGDVWMWSWIIEGCTSDCEAPSNVNPAQSDTELTENAKMTRSATNPNVYTITLVLQDFFAKSPSELKTIGFLLKGNDWSLGQTSDASYNVTPLTFTPVVNRVFPNKATEDDVVTLYLDQKLSDSPEVKYELADFSIEVKAYNEADQQLGDAYVADMVNEGNGLHQIRIIPSYSIPNVSEDIASIKYVFTSKDDAEIQTQEFQLIFLDLK